MTDRRHATTEFIRDAALGELLRVGHAALTMENVARAAYCSIGSVYSRYHSRGALYLDLLGGRIGPGIEAALGTTHAPAEFLAGFLDEGEPARDVAALTEMCIAARFDTSLVDDCRAAVNRIIQGLAPAHDEGMRWLVTAVVLGRHFLTSAGCDIPPLGEQLSVFLQNVLTLDRQDRRAAGQVRNAPVIPETPIPSSTDEISESLSREMARTLAERGLDGAHVREVAGRTGVTTGAVYRRFRSKNDLVRDTLVRELSPRRYEWTGEFLDAFAQESGRTPSDVLSDQVLSLLNDRGRALATLELIHAARNDQAIADTLATQFTAAAGARSTMFSQLRESGVVSAGCDPGLMGWLIQTAPAGARVLLSIDLLPPEPELRAGLDSVVGVLFTG